MPKPLVLPRWIATGKRAVPSTLKQDNGWDAGEQPPNLFANEHLANTYEWTQYLNTIEGEAHAWTALNSFTNLDKAHLPIDYKRLSWDNRTRFLTPGMESSVNNFQVEAPIPPTIHGGWRAPNVGTFDLYIPLPMDEDEHIKSIALSFASTLSINATVTLEVIKAVASLSGSSATVIGRHVVTGFTSAASMLVDSASSPIALPSAPYEKATPFITLWMHVTVTIDNNNARIYGLRYTTGRLAV